MKDNRCGTDFDALMGGGPEAYPERYKAASPIEAKSATPQFVFQGELDNVVPVAFARDYGAAVPAATNWPRPKWLA